jgi:ubiquinol-cytochrome c reductase iron-sulfur subunit
VRRIGRWLAFVVLLALGRRRAREERRDIVERELEPYRAPARGELAVVLLLGGTALAATAFVVLYFAAPDTQLLGLSLGLAFAFLAAALLVTSRVLVPQERREEPLGAHENLREAAEVAELVEEADDGLTRKRLLFVGAGGAGSALAAALILPAAGLGPFLGTDELFRSPWHRGRRLVDESGKPIPADDVNEGDFLTAFAEGADRRQLASSLIVIRLPGGHLRLPSSRSGWAPDGILAFSKICPHAGCAVSMYRYPLYAPGAPGPALVCPCHYSTFDPMRGGALVFGPAGRALPQLPLGIDTDGNLRAAGRFSEAIGPSWWGVRMK